MSPTLKYIAEKTGVDISTVSRVLNDDRSRGVSERKRQQVLRVANRLGYRPNHSARALRTGRHFSIGYVLAEPLTTRSNFELPFARFRLYGLEETLSARGYVLSLLRLDLEDLKSLEDRLLRRRQVDGLVFNYRAPSTSVMALLEKARLAVVVIDDDVFEQSQRTINCVLSDRENGMRQAVGHLVRQGHQRIAFISAQSNQRRFDGYFRALEEHGLTGDKRLIKSWSDGSGLLFMGRMKGYQAARELLTDKTPFTAIQAASDFTAAGAIDALREAGIRVPEDVAVVGFDDVDSLKVPPFPEPFLTTVYDPNFELGAKAAELLVAQIEDKAKPQRVLLPTRLIIRQSCGAQNGMQGGEANSE